MKKLLTAQSGISIILFLILFVGVGYLFHIVRQSDIVSCNDSIQDAMGSVYRVKTITAVKANEEGKTQDHMIVGIAFVIDNRHLLTAKHVTIIDKYVVFTPYGNLTVYISDEEKISEKTWLVSETGSDILVDVIYRDPLLDFAVLESKETLPMPYYQVGTCNHLKYGSQVLILSNYGTGHSMRTGHIAQMDFIKYDTDLKQESCDDTMFGICIPIADGDSGAPVLSCNNGYLRVEGIVSIGVVKGYNMAYAIKINTIMDRLREWCGERSWIDSLFGGRDL